MYINLFFDRFNILLAQANLSSGWMVCTILCLFKEGCWCVHDLSSGKQDSAQHVHVLGSAGLLSIVTVFGEIQHLLNLLTAHDQGGHYTKIVNCCNDNNICSIDP